MNDRQLEKKVRLDTAKVTRDISKLVGDNAARFGKFEADVIQTTGKAKEDLTTWVDEGVSQMSEGLEKLSGDARKSVVGAAAMVKKDVGHGLIQYNAKAQEIADKAPGDFGEKAARYPWVAITIAFVVGLLLGNLFKPGSQPLS